MEYYRCKVCLAHGTFDELHSHECQDISNRYLDDPDFPSLIELIDTVENDDSQFEGHVPEGKEQVESGGSEIDG